MTTNSSLDLTAVIDQAFDTHEAALLALETAVYGNKYSLAQLSFAREKLNGRDYNREARIIRYDYRCPRSHCPETLPMRPANAPPRVRPATTSGTNCPWRVKIAFFKRLGSWRVGVVNGGGSHNHEPGREQMADPNYRQWWRKSHPGVVEGWVERLSNPANMTSEHIAAFLRGDRDDVPEVAAPNGIDEVEDRALGQNFPWGDQPARPGQPDEPFPGPLDLRPNQRESMPVAAVDVRSIQRRLRATTYGPLSSTQLFLDQLEKYKRRHGILYKVQKEDTENGGSRITRVFWTFQSCVEMWKKHHSIMLADNAYKVCTNLLFSSHNLFINDLLIRIFRSTASTSSSARSWAQPHYTQISASASP